ncbi:MAG TPA: YceI family protein [Saprospiraceae bacterium]|nr:YceI family protein [Saprospiraceae bacterium]HNT19739.1 YceI family protein [Saprospiraceae bacterium]
MKLFYSTLLAVFTAAVALAGNPVKPVAYKVDPVNSKIEWTAYKMTGQHTGTLQVKQGALEFNGNKLIGGRFDIDMQSMTVTDIQGSMMERLLSHLKNDDFFSVDKFGTSSLVIKKAEQKSANLYKITADLIIKGISKEITFDATVNQSEGNASASLKVDRTLFDIKYRSGRFFPEIGDKMIKDEFDLKVNLTFAKSI